MSYPLRDLYQAVYDRLNADTGAGGLFASGSALVTGAFSIVAPSEQELPYVVIRSPSGRAPSEGFTTTSRTRAFVIEVYVARMSSVYTPLDRMASILDRIEGDWDEHADRNPTYGLNRWVPILQGTWTADIMEYQEDSEFVPEHPEVAIAHSVYFEVTASRAAG